MQFINSSLEKLVKNLSINDFKYLTQEFGSENLLLLKQKDAYPYEYTNSFERFSEEKLPDKKCFYRCLQDRTTCDNGKKLNGHINDEEYLACIKIWNELNMKNVGNYHDSYLKKDILLLANIFEKFTSKSLKSYKPDPSHYFIYPGLSWNVMLKMTGVKLEIISDIDKYLFIEQGWTGEISFICKRFSELNNKYMKNYDPTKESKIKMYLDANNLYGLAMNQYTP